MPAGEGRHEKVISVTARAAEKTLIERAADCANTSVNKWARATLLDRAREELKAYLDAANQEPSASERQTEPDRAVTPGA